MGILTKIKEYFYGPKESREDPSGTKEDQEQAHQEVNPSLDEEVNYQSNVTGHCMLCDEDILIHQKIRIVNGTEVHKRCIKRAAKQVMDGKKMEDIFTQSKGGEEDGT